MKLYPSLKTFLTPLKNVGQVNFSKLSNLNNPEPQIDFLPATFTRPNSPEDPTKSGATVIEADGTIRELAEDEAPWSYPIGGSVNGCAKLLNLPERTNLLKYSQDFNNSYWEKRDSVTVTPNSTLAPDNTLTADTVSNATGTATNTLERSETFTSGSKIASIYIKSLGATTASIRLRETLTGITTSKVVNFSDTEWQRISILNDENLNATAFQYRIGKTDGDVAIWGAQLEEGSFATSYIPTTASAVTRNNSQTTFLDLLNKGVTSSEGFSFFFDFEDFDDEEGNDSIIEFLDTSSSIILRFYSLATGITVFDSTGNGYLNSSKRATSKFILTFDGQKIKFYYGGQKQIDGNTATGGHEIDEVRIKSNGINCKINPGTGFAPYVLPEATAAALTD